MRRLLIVVMLAAVILASAIVGYALAGGFTTESEPGQELSDKVMKVWATGDAASIAAAYDPAAQVLLDVDVVPADVIASNRKQISGAAKDAIDFGNTYRQIGPVAYYEAEDGDVYVASLVDVTGPGHPNGVPLVGFYRVRSGKVIRHVFMDAEHK